MFLRATRQVSISAVALIICLSTGVVAQDSDPQVIHDLGFILSEQATAAGIDGVLKVSLLIDKDGRVEKVEILGGPAWPCNTSPKAEIEAVRAAVRDHINLIRFLPALKNGKPREAKVELDFGIGDSYKRATGIEEVSKATGVPVIRGGILNDLAIKLPAPPYLGARGVARVQILIDEKGNVLKAGDFLFGHPSAREAACDAKFSPTVLSGKPVRVFGFINYERTIRPWR